MYKRVLCRWSGSCCLNVSWLCCVQWGLWLFQPCSSERKELEHSVTSPGPSPWEVVSFSKLMNYWEYCSDAERRISLYVPKPETLNMEARVNRLWAAQAKPTCAELSVQFLWCKSCESWAGTNCTSCGAPTCTSQASRAEPQWQAERWVSPFAA